MLVITNVKKIEIWQPVLLRSSWLHEHVTSWRVLNLNVASKPRSPLPWYWISRRVWLDRQASATEFVYSAAWVFIAAMLGSMNQCHFQSNRVAYRCHCRAVSRIRRLAFTSCTKKGRERLSPRAEASVSASKARSQVEQGLDLFKSKKYEVSRTKSWTNSVSRCNGNFPIWKLQNLLENMAQNL